MPLYQRLPKRGFNSRNNRKNFDQVNLGSIQKLVDSEKIKVGDLINTELLRNVGLINKNSVHVKLLAKGTLSAKLKIEIGSASEKAKKLVEDCGGSLTIV